MENALELLKEDLLKVEAQFRRDLDSEVALIRKVGEYVLASGGKRVRPMLLLLCARLVGYGGENHIGLASVVEFIHTATLLHDDVVDSAVLRRGNASANAVWGNEASVLVGDFLFAKSFSIMVRNGDLKILQVLSDATTMMAEGEVLQLISTCDVDLDEERYITVVRTKTAVLIAAACQCGGILGRIGEEEQAALHEFGMELGIAFQFMDDALDYVAEESEFGKVRGHDLSEGKMTLPLIETLRRCSAEERSRVAEIIEQDELEEGDVAEVVALIEAHNGIEYTRNRAQTLIDRAKGHLISFPDGPAKEALFAVADYVVRRRK
ncbi:geranylgeranyl pyrophosphate synthase [Desulfuromonas soudanensis]|uniref:Geranylgeranyl pyrophosphate synthase n=1 Tax=Desulfuromonas soudanensis TaxID=1603606 RepID=A0A0M3QG27_9BACT|nr:polyprenyl synthetase family protein [Desulfuromonas soudanensis]ALC17073.1 geranylgeranyl pyrophosphate synthase [Desulfuromonas soudanensis]